MGDHNHHGHHGHHEMTTSMPQPTESAEMDAHGMHGHNDHAGHGMDHAGHGAGHTGQGGDQAPQSGGGGHVDHNMMMRMYFHAGEEETILFSFWKISELGGLVGSMVAVFLMAFAYEALKYYREHLYRHSFQTVQYNSVSLPVENGACIKETHKTVQVKIFSWMHGWQTLLHMVQVVLSYFLMLIFMTYNIWLCLAVALGAGVGYFFVGWKKSLVVDITEHCH